MEWRSVRDDPPPLYKPVYVWVDDSWHGNGPLVITKRTGSWWENEHDNGYMPNTFKPEWWAEVPAPPPGCKQTSRVLAYNLMRRQQLWSGRPPG